MTVDLLFAQASTDHADDVSLVHDGDRLAEQHRQTLAGTWTVVNDPVTGSVTGTWTLVDASGRTLAGGGWSAAKAKTGWTGAWRSIVSRTKTEYAGTWSAAVDLKPNAAFADLFEMAARTVVSGQWRAGSHSGAWSIRAYE